MAGGSLDSQTGILLIREETGMAEAKDLSERKRIQHIEEMKEQVLKLVENPEFLHLGGLISLEAQEKFLERILFMEGAEEKPLTELLENEGVRVPSPEGLDDAQLHAKLWEVINAIAGMGHYLSSTDHLSDRQLYEHLWGEILSEPTSVSPDTSTTACHIDILGGCSDEDLKLWMKYYADDDERLSWEDEFLDEMPPKEPLPYDRDRYLPTPEYGNFQTQDVC